MQLTHDAARTAPDHHGPALYGSGGTGGTARVTEDVTRRRRAGSTRHHAATETPRITTRAGPITSFPVKVTMLLCDAAQVSDGKLYILGGGWSMTGPDPVPSAVALKIDVDWHEAEASHHWELFLEDADGRPVLMETADGTQPVEVRGEFTVSQPQGIPEGSPIDVALAVNLGPIPLAPGTRFAWRLTIDGESLPGASLGFTTRPRPSQVERVTVYDRPVRPLPRGLRPRRHLPALARQDDHRVRRPSLLHDHDEPPPAAHQRVVRRSTRRCRARTSWWATSSTPSPSA